MLCSALLCLLGEGKGRRSEGRGGEGKRRGEKHFFRSYLYGKFQLRDAHNHFSGVFFFFFFSSFFDRRGQEEFAGATDLKFEFESDEFSLS